jgi:hypothetical protein
MSTAVEQAAGPTSAEDTHTPASAAEATEPIEPAGPGDVSDDEFDPQEFDRRSAADSTSVTSSLFEHAYENGRRVSLLSIEWQARRVSLTIL